MTMAICAVAAAWHYFVDGEAQWAGLADGWWKRDAGGAEGERGLTAWRRANHEAPVIIVHRPSCPGEKSKNRQQEPFVPPGASN